MDAISAHASCARRRTTTDRFKGFQVAEGLLILDSFTSELVLVDLAGGRRALHPARTDLGIAVPQLPQLVAPVVGTPPVALSADPMSVRTTVDGAAAPDLPSGIDDLDREVVLTFPYPVARPYLDRLQEANPKLRCKLLVDTFTSVLKVWGSSISTFRCHMTSSRDHERARPAVTSSPAMASAAEPAAAA